MYKTTYRLDSHVVDAQISIDIRKQPLYMSPYDHD